ncbi:transposase [Actinomadura sp. NEAU-AAG7]|uniref:transposase n=1 Tax=Actinomadura sp. NEAU-AAG7 TaxID=2839640 RepID=UPI001BE45581|nr:transposase [Actinomadura sp. NEAU-AAG7]MBT2210183.1 transposase [Actinomadura sp. NEAU-AAG7]
MDSTMARGPVDGAQVGDGGTGGNGALAVLSRFRTEFYDCLSARSDELFELADAVLCTDGPVKTLVDLALAPEHRRGHGALYGGLNRGRIEAERLRWALAALPLPRAADGRIVLAVDISPWLRPDAATSPDRSFCHTYGRGKDQHHMIPGWPYSIVAALETGRTSWTALLDAVRLEPGADAAAVTVAQIRQIVGRLLATDQRTGGDLDILIVLDAGYDVPRIAFLLDDLPVEVLGRMRSDRVLRRATPPWTYNFEGGRPPKHGTEFVFGDPATWDAPQTETTTATTRYGTAVATAWDRLHPRLTRRAAWEGFAGELPIIAGTVIRLQVDHLPAGGDPSRSGCGGPASMPPTPTSTGSGRRSCDASTSNTPSECSSRPSGGPGPSSATPKPRTAGPGSSSPPTPNCVWPGHSPPTCAAPGSAQPHLAGSPPPGCAGGFGTCA